MPRINYEWLRKFNRITFTFAYELALPTRSLWSLREVVHPMLLLSAPGPDASGKLRQNPTHVKKVRT